LSAAMGQVAEFFSRAFGNTAVFRQPRVQPTEMSEHRPPE
jgi:hypothetical protein